MATVKLLDGTLVDSASQEWQAECLEIDGAAKDCLVVAAGRFAGRCFPAGAIEGNSDEELMEGALPHCRLF